MTEPENEIHQPFSEAATPRERPIFNRKFIFVVFFMSLPFLYSIYKYGYHAQSPRKIPDAVSLYSVSFSADGSRMLAGGNQLESWVLDISPGEMIRRIPNSPQGVISVCLSPDGKKALIGEIEGKVSIWYVDEKTSEPVFTFKTPSPDKGHRNHPQYLSRYLAGFSPNMAWAAIKDMYGEVRLWDANTGDSVRLIDQEDDLDEIRCLAFSPDGQWLATGRRGSGEVRVFRADTGEKIGAVTHPPRCQVIAFTPDGSRIITGGSEDFTARVWDTQTFKEIQSFRHPNLITAFAVSPDGSTLAIGGFEGSVKGWNLQSGQIVYQFQEETHAILAMKYDPASSNLRSINSSGCLREWNPVTGKCVWYSEGYKKGRKGKIIPIPVRNPEEEMQKINQQMEALLDEKMDGALSVEKARIDELLANLKDHYGLPYVLEPSVKDTWTFNNIVLPNHASVAMILESVCKRYQWDYIIQADETIHIGRPQTITKISKPGDIRDFSQFQSLTNFSINNTKFEFMYLQDLIDQLKEWQNFSCIVEDDLYPLLTFKIENPTRKQCLDKILLPNGLDYLIQNGQIIISTTKEIQWKKKARTITRQPVDVPLPEYMTRRLEGIFAIDRKPLSEILSDLHKQTGLKYILNASPSVQVSCRLNSPPLSVLLDTILPPQGMDYLVQNDGTVFIDGMESLIKKTDVLLTPQKLTSLLIKYNSRFNSSIFTYTGKETIAGSIGTTSEREDRQQLEELLMAFRRRKTGTITAFDEKKWGRITDMQFSELIESASEMFNGFTRDVSQQLSVQGQSRRRDIFRQNDRGEQHFYLFDGNYFYIKNPRSKIVRLGYEYPHAEDYLCRYGADLDWFLKQGNTIHEVDNQARKITLFPPGGPQRDISYVFTLLEGNNAYWKECVAYSRDQPIRRILCEDFTEFEGMLVPRKVQININESVRSELQLMDAKIDRADFPKGFFQVSAEQGFAPRAMGQ